MSNKVVLDKTIEDALADIGYSGESVSGRFISLLLNDYNDYHRLCHSLDMLERVEDLLGADVCAVEGSNLLLRWRTEVNT